MSCGVGYRRGSDPAWLWHRPASTAPIRPLAWEPLYAAGADLEKAKRPKKKKKKKKKKRKYSLNGTIYIYIYIKWALCRDKNIFSIPLSKNLY